MITRLDSLKIPLVLHGIIPLAEEFGVSDDCTREALVMRASEEKRRALKAAVREFDDDLDLWLAGPEAAGPKFSREYIAFSAMRMAADYI
jgi:hypothetical protein